jgi:hypothetical protein
LKDEVLKVASKVSLSGLFGERFFHQKIPAVTACTAFNMTMALLYFVHFRTTFL